MRFFGNFLPQLCALGLLLGAGAAARAADTTPAVPQDPTDYHMVLFDTDPIPAWFPQSNPYNKMASLNSWTTPVLDHTGKPHQHGHVIQVVMDGGNGRQDPPNADGSPGGDDSLAYGNLNMIRLLGVEGPNQTDQRTGMFYSQRYFIPYYENRAYYLRLWEGDDVAIAPYYQDTIEYSYDQDRGGAMLRIPEGPPIDVDWKFGPSKPRPKAAAAPKTP